MELTTSISQLSGVGPGLFYKLKRLNLNTIEDLIYHFPFRYDDFSQSSTIKDAQIGQIVTLTGEIWSIKNVFTRSRKVLTHAVFNDGSSPLELTWFNQSWLIKQIQVGDRLQVSGKLSKYKNKLNIMMPKWEKITSLQPTAYSLQPLHTGRLVPIYPETEGLTSKWVRTKIDQILPQIKDKLKDPLPDFIKGSMMDFGDAISKIHFPNNWEDVKKSQERLGFDELFFVSLATQKTKLEWEKKPLSNLLKIDSEELNKFTKSLPFELTKSQIKVLSEIISDLQGNKAMNRLVQGEVGSGKTVVATIAAFLVYKNNFRTLLMAPTEILAFQHYETISKLLNPFGISVGIYTGSRKSTQTTGNRQKKKKTNAYRLSPEALPDIIIGTHALLSEKLNTDNVGLIIVDEQQRFGVEQRALLRNKAKLPHFLTMTATPIPRTIALTLYGDLDLSIIDELPKGRQKIKTYVVSQKKRSDAYGFIEKKVKQGDQVYIITPLIEAPALPDSSRGRSETMQSAKAAKDEYEKLQKEIFPKLKLGLMHGRLKSSEKEEVMQKFKNGKLDILVSTSVVEVGVDVPNATIMIIESAERFGLSQLHQLRGRIGRGKKQSYCLLFSETPTQDNISRLKNLEKIDNGLKLAELDLKIRGGGEMFGIKQSGRFEFKIASLSDLELVEKTRSEAKKLLQDNPTLDKYPQTKAKLEKLTSNAMPD